MGVPFHVFKVLIIYIHIILIANKEFHSESNPFYRGLEEIYFSFLKKKIFEDCTVDHTYKGKQDFCKPRRRVVSREKHFLAGARSSSSTRRQGDHPQDRPGLPTSYCTGEKENTWGGLEPALQKLPPLPTTPWLPMSVNLSLLRPSFSPALVTPGCFAWNAKHRAGRCRLLAQTMLMANGLAAVPAVRLQKDLLLASEHPALEAFEPDVTG